MKKLPIDYLRTLGTTVGDVSFPQTELLLPFDGANGATTTSDLSDNNHSVTFGGTAQISTADKKIGESSLLLDGNSDYVSLPASSHFDFGTGDFTVECWVKTSNYSSNSNSRRIFHFGSGNGADDLQLIFTDVYGEIYTSNVRISGTIALANGNWNHVAVTRVGVNSPGVKLYVNGVQSGSTWATTADFGGGGDYGLTIGKMYNAAGHFDGYIDAFRVTKGMTRYTSNFTPPTTAYLTSAGDVNKQIIVNSAADGVAIGTGGINQARIAKAWVNFTGTGTVAIMDSYNISSLTDNGTGYYTVSFSTAMSNIYYSVVGMGHETTDTASQDAAVRIYHDSLSNVMQTGLFKLSTGIGPLGGYGSFDHKDAEVVMTQVFGN
jgi:hypothetical protein